MFYSKYTSRLLVIGACSTLLLTGCGTTDKNQASKPNWNTSTKLEIPPDLTAPRESKDTHLYSAVTREASAEKLAEYEKFQQLERMAEYEEFLNWRQQRGNSQNLSLADFREAQSTELRAQLTDKGVLVVKGPDQQRIVLIADSLQNSWNRVDTALINMGLQVLEANPKAGFFRIHYDTESSDDESIWMRWAFWRHDQVIYTLWLTADEEMISATIFDADAAPVVTPQGDTFMERLGVQLLTFAGKHQQFVAGGNREQKGLALRETPEGRLQMIIPGGAKAAWTRLDRVLGDAGFSVIKKDPETLLFVLRYDDPENSTDPGFFSQLVFWKKDEPDPQRSYQLQITPAGDRTMVDLLDSNEQRTQTGDKILTLLFNKLKDD